MAKKEIPDDLTPSICEAALDRFRESDDSLAGVIEQHHINVRDFMILSLVCDQGDFGVAPLTSALGLNPDAVIICVERMVNAGLLQLHSENGTSVAECRIRPTAAGQLLTRKILDIVS